MEKDKSKVKASPAIKKMIKDLGFDINEIKGCGKEGRITLEDIKRYIDEVSVSSAVISEPIIKQDKSKYESIEEEKTEELAAEEEVVEELEEVFSKEEELEEEIEIEVRNDDDYHTITNFSTDQPLEDIDKDAFEDLNGLLENYILLQEDFDIDDDEEEMEHVYTRETFIHPDYSHKSYGVTFNGEDIEEVEDISLIESREVKKALYESNIVMGIEVNLLPMHDMLSSYNFDTEQGVFYGILKALDYVLSKNKISGFHSEFNVFRYGEDDNLKVISNVNHLKISEFCRKFMEALEEDEVGTSFRVVDMSMFSIDFYQPKPCRGEVEVIILGDTLNKKIIINGDEDIISLNECGNLCSDLKKVLKNPSLMII